MRRAHKCSLIVLAGALLAGGLAGSVQPAAAQNVPQSTASGPAQVSLILVELFTAQGCEACRPANLSIANLAEAPGFLVLTFSVDHWDYLGWRDTHAKPEFSARQRAYAESMGIRGLKTPQVIVNGARSESGAALSRVAEIIRRPALGGEARLRLIDRGGGALKIEIDRDWRRSGLADVWLATYDPRPASVTPARGEAAGAPIVQRNVVRELNKIGDWSGAAARLEAQCRSACAVIVQEPGGGRVLAAAAHHPAP